MVVNRDIDAGLTIGYGDDILRYLSAFYAINNDFSFVSVYSKVFSLTGSAEFLFWLFSYLVMNLTSNIYFTWYSIVFLSLSTVYYSLERLDYKSAGFIFSCFLLTITFHVYAGSIIRQLLAFSFVTLSLSFYLSRDTYKQGMLFSLMPPFFHLSSIFFPVIVFSWNIFSHIKTKILFLLPVFFVFILILFKIGIIEDSFIYNKIDARVYRDNEFEGGWSWLLQFTLELVVVLFFLKVAFSSIFKRDIFKIFILFCLIVFLCIPLNYVSIRLYRYAYCFYIIFAVLYFRTKSNKIPLFFMLLFFLSYWIILLTYKYWPSYGGSFLDAFFYNIQSIIMVKI